MPSISRTRRLAFALLATAAALAFIAVWRVGSLLSAPARAMVGEAPAALQAQNVELRTEAGDTVRGWYSAGSPGSGAVLLLHGVRGSRTAMLGRATFLHRTGYSVLLIDLPAHGESGGEQISFGKRESAGVRAAMQWLAQRLPQERIGVIGVSLGAASFVLGEVRPSPAAVVLESMYPTIEDAVADRLGLHLGDWARPLSGLLLAQLPLRLDLSADELRPIAHIARIGSPVFILAGDQDRHTRLPETQALFAAASEPKQLWIVEGAAHEDLHAFDHASYEARVGSFLQEKLRTP